MLHSAPGNSNKVDKVTDCQNNREDQLKRYQSGGADHCLRHELSLEPQINNSAHYRNYKIRDQDVIVHAFQRLSSQWHPIFRQP